MKPKIQYFDAKIEAVAKAKTDNFVELAKLSGYNFATDFKYRDLNKANFSDCDLSGFNFCGSKITRANFEGAKIAKAVFDGRQKRLRCLRLAVDFDDLAKEKDQLQDTPRLTEEERFITVIKAGDIEVVHGMLANNVDLANTVTTQKNKPLTMAGYYGHGFDRDYSALMVAVLMKRRRVSETLIGAGSDINHTSRPQRTTALMLACNLGSISIVRLLLNEKTCAEVNHEDLAGATALIIACRRGSTKIIAHLIKYGANLEVLDGYNSSALMYALRDKRSSIVEFLCKNGAKIHHVKHFYSKHLIISVVNRDIKSIKILIRYGADVNEGYEGGNTALIVATLSGNVRMVKLLLDNGAKKDAVNYRAESALTIAKQTYNDKLVKLLS